MFVQPPPYSQKSLLHHSVVYTTRPSFGNMIDIPHKLLTPSFIPVFFSGLSGLRVSARGLWGYRVYGYDYIFYHFLSRIGPSRAHDSPNTTVKKHVSGTFILEGELREIFSGLFTSRISCRGSDPVRVTRPQPVRF